MSDAWNLKLPEEQLEQLNMRAKFVLSELQVVLNHTRQRKSVSEIARLLGRSRNHVIWLQLVLQLRTGKAWRSGAAREAAAREHGELHTLTETKTFGRHE